MPETSPEKKRLILVVDDEELNIDMLSRRLVRAGFDVHTAHCGKDAIDLVERHTYDVLLLDHMMPNMTGREVLALLRVNHSPEALPIIMVTAIAESDKVAEALGAGANDYITKPIDFRVALARIQTQFARKDAETALRVSEERYALAAKASRDGLWDWDLGTDQIYFSPRWMEMTGLGHEGLLRDLDYWTAQVFHSDKSKLLDCIHDHLAGVLDWFGCEYRMQHASGGLRWMSLRAVITRDTTGRAIRLSGSQSDVTEEKTRDALTHLPNRVAMHSLLEGTYLRHASSTCAAPAYALLFLDLDGFKYVNDSFGHLAGDQLLRAVAGKLQAAVGQLLQQRQGAVQAYVARLSGDEFAILVEGACAKTDAEALAAAVQRLMASPVMLVETPVSVAFSIGIAPASPEHRSYESVIADADMAMYAAKGSGRGMVVFFTAELRTNSLDRMQIENDLRYALKRNELFLVFQPKVHLHNSEVYGVEALLRWEHPTRGLINPGQFIPIAEQTGMIVEIGHWVLETACRQILHLHRLHPLDPKLELSVNLSPREFKHCDLVERISSILRATGFPPECLHLEITEGVLFEDIGRARECLLGLKRLGVGLELDDFGSGYSSLRYLQELPFDTLKIDRYFMASLDSGAEGSSNMLKTIVAMAAHLDLKVVAEGIERSPHAVLMREMGCDFGQGYLFSRPVRMPELERLVQGLAAQQRKLPLPAHHMQPAFHLGMAAESCI